MLHSIVSRALGAQARLNALGRNKIIYPRSYQPARGASQLYPTTGQQWDDAMIRAELTVGDASNFSNLHQWLSGEFSSITKYLQRLVGTNHPMLETAKRCTYISEGKMGSAQARGLTVMLTAKAVSELARHANNGKLGDDIIRNQISLAEMTEMTYSAYMIHRGVMDLQMHGLEAVDVARSTDQPGGTILCTTDQTYQPEPNQLGPQQARALHYGNKVSVLCGDFLLAYVMRGLGELFSAKVVDLVASAITQFMEGEFMLIDDWRSKNYLLSSEARDLDRWTRRSYATIGSLQGNTCQAAVVLANITGQLQVDAREMGKNIGLAWQAHTELQPFLRSIYEPIELPEMPPYPAYDLNCLPVLLFLRNKHNTSKNFRLFVNEIKCIDSIDTHRDFNGQSSALPLSDLAINQHRHQETVNYAKLHDQILNNGRVLDETYSIIKSYSQKAMRHMESFPPSEAKDVLLNICESLYKK